MTTSTTRRRLARVTITRGELESFHELVLRKHWIWPGPVFSVNPSRRIWPFVCSGCTPEEERDYIDGLSPVIDAVAEQFLYVRDLGGRFFINERGAFYRPFDGYVQLVRFDVED